MTPGYGVRSVLRGCSIPQDFNTLDRAHGYRVHIGTRGSAPYRPVDVDERAAVAPLSV